MMKIILDFDDAIFDTGGFNREIANIFIKSGFSEDDYERNYQRSMDSKSNFDADFIIELFAEIKQTNKGKIKSKIEAVIKGSKKFVYDDFYDFAKSFNKKDLTLVSAGLKEIQAMKIANAGIVSFFNKISIPKKYKSDEIKLIAQKYPAENIFFIDDKAKQIDEAKKRLPRITAIKMERASGRHILPKSELADYAVKNFAQVKDIISGITKKNNELF